MKRITKEYQINRFFVDTCRWSEEATNRHIQDFRGHLIVAVDIAPNPPQHLWTRRKPGPLR